MKVLEKIESYYGPFPTPYSIDDAFPMQQELHNIVCELTNIRDSKEKTKEYFNNIIRNYRSSSFEHPDELIVALHTILEDDKLSFSYIYFYITEWAQGVVDWPIYKCPTQKEIEYAINFDLDEIEERINKSEKPIETIKEILNNSRRYISLNTSYKTEVEENLLFLLKSYGNSSIASESSVTIDFLARHDREDEDMTTLHRLFDGRKGKELAIAVCVAVNEGIITKSPSHKKLKNYFDVKGSDSGYEKYQDLFLKDWLHKAKPKDKAAYEAIRSSLDD